MAGMHLLLTGATGYIGGSVLSTLLTSNCASVRDLTISVLVRREDQAKVLAEKDVKPILFCDLDDVERIRQVAREHDIVINTASGFHDASAKALILGLGERKKHTGKDVYYIHTSGTSNMGDKPITGEYHELHTFSDKENIFAYEKSREAIEPYEQRTTDIVVIETGLQAGVKTYIIMSPTIYGEGTGSFHTQSIQIPTLIRSAMKRGAAEMIGKGEAVWDHVHIADLVLLYELILARVISGDESVPSGEKGIFFSETGQFTWRELAESIAKAGHDLRALKSADVHSLTLDEAAKQWSGGSLQRAELGFASNSRTRGDMSRELGWEPTKTKRDFEENSRVEFKQILAAGGK